MGSVRKLGCILTANGRPFKVKECEVNQTSTQGSDTFHATIACDAASLKFFSDADEIDVSIEVIAAGDSGLLFVGSADSCETDFDHMLVELSGRDKSKGPIETKSNESFKNKTSSQIVEEIAGRHGLKPVIKATSPKAGKQFKADWVALSDNVSEWTVVQHLADREGMVAFIQDNELHFQPLDDDDVGDIDVRYVPPSPAFHAIGDNVIHLKGRHNLQLAKKTKVKVHSWDSKQKKVIEATKEHSGGGSGLNDYVYRHAHLKKGQADQIAEKRLREHTRHELTIDLDMPGSAKIKPRKRLNLSGTGTCYDQAFYIDHANHRIGDGYRCHVTAKNTKGGKS